MSDNYFDLAIKQIQSAQTKEEMCAAYIDMVFAEAEDIFNRELRPKYIAAGLTDEAISILERGHVETHSRRSIKGFEVYIKEYLKQQKGKA